MPLNANAKDYCENLFGVRRSEAEQKCRDAQHGLKGLQGRTGGVYALADGRIELMRQLAQARAECLRLAYEWQGDQLSKSIIAEIVRDVGSFVEIFRAAYLNSETAERTMRDRRTARNPASTNAYLEELSRRLMRAASSIQADILNLSTVRMYEDMKNPPKPEEQPKHVVSIHLSGPNARLNIQSTDESINVASVTTEQFFGQLRQELGNL